MTKSGQNKSRKTKEIKIYLKRKNFHSKKIEVLVRFEPRNFVVPGDSVTSILSFPETNSFNSESLDSFNKTKNSCKPTNQVNVISKLITKKKKFRSEKNGRFLWTFLIYRIFICTLAINNASVNLQ